MRRSLVGWDDPGDGWGYSALVKSEDGGDNFSYAGTGNIFDETTWMKYVYDLDVSIEVDGVHDIVVAWITDDFLSSGCGGYGCHGDSYISSMRYKMCNKTICRQSQSLVFRSPL